MVTLVQNRQSDPVFTNCKVVNVDVGGHFSMSEVIRLGQRTNRIPLMVNARGQTLKEWVDMVDARASMVAASGYPVGRAEASLLAQDMAEWERLSGA